MPHIAQTLAYLDPGSGSMILQIVLGGFAAVGVALKMYWKKITSIFRRDNGEPADPGIAQTASESGEPDPSVESPGRQTV